MNTEVKKKWVEALRSGQYPPAISQLRHKDAFCCLGVLCDLHSKETGEFWLQETYLGEPHYLPRPVVEWSGLDSNDPSVVLAGNNRQPLSSLNDRARSFDDIARWIEEQL